MLFSLTTLANVLQAVDYSKQTARDFDSSPAGNRNGRKSQYSDSDTDFQERDESEEEPESGEEGADLAAHELESDVRRSRNVRSSIVSPGKLNMDLMDSLSLADIFHSSRFQTRSCATHIT